MWIHWNKPRAPEPRFAALAELWRNELRCPSQHTSLLFFTVHKAASSFAAQLLEHIACNHSIRMMDYDGYLRATPPSPADAAYRPTLDSVCQSDEIPDLPGLQTRLQWLFRTHGCLYAPIRRPPLLAAMDHLDEFQSIVLLRDPRDCLTSLYFSVVYSHQPPKNTVARQQFFEHREQVRQLEIDDFVMAEAPQWLERYLVFVQALQRPRVHLLTYEQLVLDFPRWLDQLAHIWQLQLSRPLRNRLSDLANFKVEREDVFSHKRQVMPGDHRRKLKPVTIEQITELFRRVLVPLGYPLDSSGARAA